MQLKIITQEREILSAEVEHAIFPGEVGLMDILPDHARLVSLLREGEIQYFNNEKKGVLIKSGLIEVSHDNITALVDVVY